MVDFTRFLNKVIEGSISHDQKIKPSMIWEFKYNNDTIYQYKTKIILSGKKHLYLILTKRRLSNDINIYLEVYLSVKPNNNDNNYDFSSMEKPTDPEYKYKNIRSMFLNSYPDLLKLYGIVKYNNYLSYTRTKELFVKDLIEWTKKDLLPWKSNDNKYSYTCTDTIHKDMEIYIRAGKERLFVFLNGGKYKHFTLANILLDSKNLLFNTIKETGR